MKNIVFSTILRMIGLLILIGVGVAMVHSMIFHQPSRSFLIALTYVAVIGVLLSGLAILSYKGAMVGNNDVVQTSKATLVFLCIGLFSHFTVEFLLFGTVDVFKAGAFNIQRIVLSMLVSTAVGFYGYVFVMSRTSALDDAVEDNMEPAILGAIPIRMRNTIKLVDFESIIYLESQDKYVNVYTDENKYLAGGTLAAWMGKLPAEFVRIHRGYIINQQKVNEIHKEARGMYAFVMCNDAVLKSGNTYAKALRRLFESN